MARKWIPALTLVVVLAAPFIALLVAQRFAGGAAGLRPGQTLPPAELADLEGRPVDTRSWANMPTLLVLYRSTCKACEREIEALIHISPDLPKLRIVLLSLDAAAPRVSTEFRVLRDPSGRFVGQLRRLMVPTLYLVSRQGMIVYVRSGQSTPEKELATLTSLLAAE